MQTVTSTTWAPGSNSILDILFDTLREKQHQDKTHRLWKNYSKKMMDDCVACTIVFNCDNQPIVCSSISARSCWPEDTYRIYNRLWKPNDRKEYLRQVTPGVGAAGASQIEWLEQHTNFKLYFISRETSNWQDWMIDSFKNDYQIHFTKDPYKYLTCFNKQQDACWQYIIYNGNQDILKQWKHR